MNVASWNFVEGKLWTDKECVLKSLFQTQYLLCCNDSYYRTTAAENMTLGTQGCNKQTSLLEVLYAAN